MRRFTDAPSLNRPRKNAADYVDFIALDGGCGTFDITESVGVKPDGDENVWYGREICSREWEVLYRTIEGRWVLVFVLPPGHEDDAGPINRALAPPERTRPTCRSGTGRPRRRSRAPCRSSPSRSRLDAA